MYRDLLNNSFHDFQYIHLRYSNEIFKIIFRKIKAAFFERKLNIFLENKNQILTPQRLKLSVHERKKSIKHIFITKIISKENNYKTFILTYYSII